MDTTRTRTRIDTYTTRSNELKRTCVYAFAVHVHRVEIAAACLGL